MAGRVASLRDVADWAVNLPPDSATFRAEHEDGRWQHTEQLELSRARLYHLERVAFFTAKTAGYKTQEPEPYLFPWEEDPDEAIKGDSMEMDDAADWLGWTEEMRAHLNQE